MNKITLIKNILKIIISILIIGTLLRSCANARVLTDIELKNFILNGYRDMYNSIPTETIQNNVLNKDWSTWLNLMATHEGHYGLQIERGSNSIYLYYIAGSDANLRDYNPYVYRTSDYATQVSRNTTTYYSYNIGNNTFTNNVNGSGWFIKCKSDYYYYTDCNIKTNSSNQGSNGTNYLTARKL